MSDVAKIALTDFASPVAAALEVVGAADRLPDHGLVILKPNLTTASPPPVTTNVAVVEAVWRYCREHCAAEIAIGEGCGSGTTDQTFEANGYTDLARRANIRLIDFNTEPSVKLRRADTLQRKEFHLPEVAREAFIVSIPALKDHSMTDTTIALKNMFGLAPAPYCRGSWNRSKLHSPSTHRSVRDVGLYKPPDLCVVDGRWP